MPDYEHYMNVAGVSRSKAIPALRKEFPLFGKSAMSMVCNPTDYGVQLTRDAEAVLVDNFGYAPGLSARPKRKQEHRRKANRLYVRLDDAMYARLEECYSRSCFASKQDLIEAALSDFCNRMEVVRR
jgi:hypothetical protein